MLREDFGKIQVVYQPRRRRAVFVTTPSGVVELRVPAGLSRPALLRLIGANKELIDKLLRRAAAEPPPEPLTEGRMLPLLGRNYPLRFSVRLLTFDDAFIVPRSPDPETALRELYRRLASAWLPERCRKILSDAGLSPGRIRINSARTRWGSCSRDGDFNLNWRLIQLPEELIDYVICHETCHRFEFNHSPAFWERLTQMMPDAELRRCKLRDIERSRKLWP